MTETPGKRPGADAPELDELARRLLDLWQDQLTAVAANPDLATQAARLMAATPLPGMWLSQLGQMGQAGANGGALGGPGDMTKAWAKMTQDWMSQDWFKGVQSGRSGERADPAAPKPSASVPPGAKTAATAPQPGGGDLGELSRRLAGIEQRLGELAEQSKPKSRATKSKTPASKPRRARAADPGSGSGGSDDGPAA